MTKTLAEAEQPTLLVTVTEKVSKVERALNKICKNHKI